MTPLRGHRAARSVGVGLLLVCGWPVLRTTQKPLPTSNSRNGPQAGDARRGFVGDSVCKECHAGIAATYLHTNHHITSQPPSKDTIAGSFSPGHNLLKTTNPDLRFRMEARPSGFYETAVFWQPPDQQTQTERIDIVTGSGVKGQTYLYWKGDQLFQLPVSYWTDLRAWVNSPGFTDGEADFQRPIVPRCLECHATYFASVPLGSANSYRRTGFILGISCERCHGPGAQHVERERHSETDANHVSFIVNPAKLDGQRQIEVCAQCHGGIGESLAPAFTYVPGEALEKYIRLQQPAEDAPVDVHGNQVALTMRSRCFQNSQMTCSTCHNVHSPEMAPAAYSEKCLQCHKVQECGEFSKQGERLRQGCVDCHMPLQDSKLIISNVDGKQVNAKMRNHWITVYPTVQNPPSK